MASPFPTLKQIIDSKLTYIVPTPEVSAACAQASNAARRLHEVLGDLRLGDATAADFRNWTEEVRAFADTIGTLLPEATPETTRIANDILHLRMQGNQVLLGSDIYRDDAHQNVRSLKLLIQGAIALRGAA